MAITAEDFHDVAVLRDRNPDWQRELRRPVLSDDLLTLPAQFTAAQARSDEQFAALRAADQRLVRRLDDLAAEVHGLNRHTDNRLCHLDGAVLEQQFAARAPADLGALGLRRARVLAVADWVSKVEDAVDAGMLGAEEGNEIRRLDAIVHARDEAGEVWLAVDVSLTVDVYDVERAVRRTCLLSRALGRSRTAAAGERLTEGAQQRLAATPDSITVRWASHH